MDKIETKKSLRAGFFGLALVGMVFFVTLFRGPILKKINLEEKVSSEKKNFPEEKRNPSLAVSSSELLKNIREVIVVDLRAQDSFLVEHIIDSRNIPAEKLAQNYSLLDNSKKYVFLDDGNDALAEKMAEEISQQEEFSGKIKYLSGGFLGWKKDQNPTISFGDPLSLSDQAKVSYIDCQKLKEIIDKENLEEFFILDVRRPEEFSRGHLKNATNIFLEDLEKERKKIPLGKKVIVSDNDGFWAYMASVRLFDLGIKNTLTLSEGLDSWKEKGFEIFQ